MNMRSGRSGMGATAMARSGAILAMLLTSWASAARAQAPGAGGAWDVAVGMGVLSTSAYPGSDERYAVPFPEARATYRTGELSLSLSVLGGASLTWMDLDHGMIGGLSVRPGRNRDRDGYSILGVPVDHNRRTRDLLRRAPDVSTPLAASAMLALPTPVGIVGASVGWEPTTVSPGRAGGTDRRCNGFEYSLLYMMRLPAGSRLSVAATGRLAFVDRDYATAWYGVENPTSSPASFGPGAGLHDAELSLQLDYALTDRIELSVLDVSTVLLGAARRSPLTQVTSARDMAVALLWHL